MSESFERKTSSIGHQQGLSTVFLDLISISDSTRRLIRQIQYQQPESVMHCNMFLNYITSRTLMGNMVDDFTSDEDY